jgi:hypothetical protein
LIRDANNTVSNVQQVQWFSGTREQFIQEEKVQEKENNPTGDASDISA